MRQSLYNILSKTKTVLSPCRSFPILLWGRVYTTSYLRQKLCFLLVDLFYTPLRQNLYKILSKTKTVLSPCRSFPILLWGRVYTKSYQRQKLCFLLVDLFYTPLRQSLYKILSKTKTVLSPCRSFPILLWGRVYTKSYLRQKLCFLLVDLFLYSYEAEFIQHLI